MRRSASSRSSPVASGCSAANAARASAYRRAPYRLRGPPEIGFVSLTHDQIPQRVELRRRGHRRVRERVLVVDPDERVRGLSSIARGPGGLCLLEKDLIADGQLVGGQLLVDVERAGVIAERGGRFRVAEGRGNGEVP